MKSTRLAAEGEKAVSPMTRAKVLQQLSACKADLGARFGVTCLALFGSVARDLAREDSDVDVLVSFDGPAQ